MISFTINDYFKYAPQFLQITGVRDKNEKYYLNEITHQYADKVFRDILNDKKELINFLETYFESGITNLSENDIENYNRKFVTSKFKIKESDMIYKIANKNIFIIIEHQSKIDKNMEMRILEYCCELMREVGKDENGKYPLIYPIVLYTGNEKWKVPKSIEQEENKYYNIPKQEYPKYNIVDINDYTKEQLIEENTAISKALLFEKVRTKKEIIDVLEKLSKKELTKQEKKYIKIILLYSNKIRRESKEIAEMYLDKLSEEDKNMNFERLVLELIEDGKQEGKLEGKREGKREGKKEGIKLGKLSAMRAIVKEMIKNHISDEQIMQITKIDKEELDKLKIA